MKQITGRANYTALGRAPHGARGLKHKVRRFVGIVLEVAPRMGRVD